MRDQLRAWIVHQVKINGGISNTRLWINVSGLSNNFTTQDYHNVLDDLIRDGDIIRLVFSDSGALGKNKQVFFLKGTQFMNLKDFISERTGDASEETNTSKGVMANKSSPDV